MRVPVPMGEHGDTDDDEDQADRHPRPRTPFVDAFCPRTGRSTYRARSLAVEVRDIDEGTGGPRRQPGKTNERTAMTNEEHHRCRGDREYEDSDGRRTQDRQTESGTDWYPDTKPEHVRSRRPRRSIHLARFAIGGSHQTTVPNRIDAV